MEEEILFLRSSKMHSQITFESTYYVCVDSFYPQFRPTRKSRPFGDQWYVQIWIEGVNSTWREIIDCNAWALGMFYGSDHYVQFEAAFLLFEKYCQQSNPLGRYSIASTIQELTIRHGIDVSPGHCMLGAKFAGFELHFNMPPNSETIDPRYVIADVKRGLWTDTSPYEPAYGLSV